MRKIAAFLLRNALICWLLCSFDSVSARVLSEYVISRLILLLCTACIETSLYLLHAALRQGYVL